MDGDHTRRCLASLGDPNVPVRLDAQLLDDFCRYDAAITAAAVPPHAGTATDRQPFNQKPAEARCLESVDERAVERMLDLVVREGRQVSISEGAVGAITGQCERWLDRLPAGNILAVMDVLREDLVCRERRPALLLRIALCQARALARMGKHDEAMAAVGSAYAGRLLLADPNEKARVVAEYAQAALARGDAQGFEEALLEGVRLFYGNDGLRWYFVRTFLAVRGGWRRTFLDSRTKGLDKTLLLLFWLYLEIVRRQNTPPAGLGRVIRRVALGWCYVVQYGLRGGDAGLRGASMPVSRPAAVETQPQRSADTLVTRAMGGIGDLLMMTHGLHQLRRLVPAQHEVVLAIPKTYFPLFDSNPDVRVMDIADLTIDAARGFGRWCDLTDCPAARVESRTMPRVARNRVGIFAEAMGCRRHAAPKLWYYISDQEREWAERFWSEHGFDSNMPVVGVQPKSAEPYKDYPHVASVISSLTSRAKVLILHSGPVDVPLSQDVVHAAHFSMRQSFALAQRCALIVAPDSVFLHLAAAFGLPCVGLFGPTDGRLRCGDYPDAVPLDARQSYQCVPCWRNQRIPCRLTGGPQSACMAAIAPASVVTAIVSCLDKRLHQTGR